MNILHIAVLTLAAWRISSLFVYEDGPLNIFERFRYFLGVRYNELSDRHGTTFLSELIVCMWCFSIWTGVVITAMYALLGEIAVYGCLPFAISACCIFVDKATE